MKKKIKVLQIIHSLHIGGAEKVVVDIASMADSTEFNVVVCCIKEGGVLAEKLEDMGVSVIVAPKIGSVRYTRIIRGLYQVIREQQPDIIHTHGDISLIDTGPVYLYGLFRPFPKWIHTFHFGNYPHIKKRYLYAQMLFSRFVDRLVAVSHYQSGLLQQYMKIPGPRIQVIENGVNPNPCRDDRELVIRKKQELGIPEGKIVVGSIAVLTVQKGIVYFLEAVKEVIDTHKNVHFIVVGGGPLQKELEAKARALGIQSAISFAGWRSDVMELFPMIDIFVMPSLWEAFSVVLIEAMAAGKMIIATDVADNARVIEHNVNGIIVEPKSAHQLSKAIGSLLEHPQMYREFGDKAFKKFEQNYTVNKMIGKYEVLFAETVV
ncbi:MAG: glycosyltransferase family 4 protein [Gammaproteobacteria bacterium]|nr:glycosyltransferase family 4 protein [Gammaproteobacteria bacterium]MDH5799248.1 glycosyltransferase family 4 protein [Gammaproteobacteria bacterium]